MILRTLSVWSLPSILFFSAIGLSIGNAACRAADTPLIDGARFTVDPATEVPLALGWNALDLSFDGHPYHVLGQRNEINTAHSNVTFTFVDAAFDSVFFEPGDFLNAKLAFPTIHSSSISTMQGADYQLVSVRLLMNPKTRAAYLVRAARDFGHSFVDSEPVTMELFALRQLPEESGNSPEAFVLIDLFRTAKCYADSNYALATEFGLAIDVSSGEKKADQSTACTP